MVTYEKLKSLMPSERDLPEIIAQKGLVTRVVVWDDSTVDWTQFDLVIIRSTWDYFSQLPRFINWLNELEAMGVPVLNPVESIRENIHKFYLKELEERGFSILETEFLEANSVVSLTALMSARQWEEVILKPAISALAHNTYRIGNGDIEEGQQKLNGLLSGGDVLVQAFCPEVLTTGEWSMVFLGGKYSHSVLKCPKEGDFRSQQYYGGHLSFDSPPKVAIEMAQKLVSEEYSHLLYARVDGVEVNGHFYIMEVELIEPRLYLEAEPGLMEKFADLIVARLN